MNFAFGGRRGGQVVRTFLTIDARTEAGPTGATVERVMADIRAGRCRLPTLWLTASGGPVGPGAAAWLVVGRFDPPPGHPGGWLVEFGHSAGASYELAANPRPKAPTVRGRQADEPGAVPAHCVVPDALALGAVRGFLETGGRGPGTWLPADQVYPNGLRAAEPGGAPDTGREID